MHWKHWLKFCSTRRLCVKYLVSAVVVYTKHLASSVFSKLWQLPGDDTFSMLIIFSITNLFWSFLEENNSTYCRYKQRPWSPSTETKESVWQSNLSQKSNSNGLFTAKISTVSTVVWASVACMMNVHLCLCKISKFAMHIHMNFLCNLVYSSAVSPPSSLLVRPIVWKTIIYNYPSASALTRGVTV